MALQLASEARLDPRVKRTRQLLQQALFALMSETDFQSITVQDIAARAEVNRATFYAHFEDKYALINYAMRESLREKLATRLPESPTFTAVNVRGLFLAVCEFVADFHGHCKPLAHGSDYFFMFSQLQIEINAVLLDWLSHTTMRGGRVPSSDGVTAAISWLILGTVLNWVQSKRRIAPEELADQSLAVLLTGITPYLADK